MKWKKIIPPVIITILVIIYLVLYYGVLVYLIENKIIKVLLIVIPALLGVAMIFVCIERIKEIRGGEEDDLSKY